MMPFYECEDDFISTANYRLWLIFIVFICMLPRAFSRTVPARVEICNRFPNMQLCQGDNVASQTAAPQQSVATNVAVAQQPSPIQRDTSLKSAGLSLDQFCTSYKEKFDSICTGTNSQAANPSDAQAVGFCGSYSANCVTQAKLDPTINSASRSPSADEKARYCSTYEQGFYKNCNDPSNDPNRVKFCKAYFNYCDMASKLGPIDAQRSEQVPPVPASLQPSADTTSSAGRASDLPGPFPTANTSAVVRAQCEKYKVLGDAYCPGYEVTEMRKNCNMYRVYCQGKAPFPGIDGNIGFTKDVWEVQGIPFYPFNDAGAIAGGTKSNVGYGDWGGSYTERSGVSDFWDASKKYEANWQRGNYMFSDGWNVPLTGISGFKQNGVTLGGLGNPSDWPSVVSGGILPRSSSNNFMPSLGAGTMPLFGGGLSNGASNLIPNFGRRKR